MLSRRSGLRAGVKEALVLLYKRLCETNLKSLNAGSSPA